MYFIGYDIGSSSIKAALLNAETGKQVANAVYPKTEMQIISKQNGWAEQQPETWWDAVKFATKEILSLQKINPDKIKGIGISYQMHGLVLVDKNKKVLRPSIIWCDSRAVDIGNEAFQNIGKEFCLNHTLNSPANFTASKLKWVKENEPHIFEKIYKAMLPGDFIAMKLTGETATTISGLSEGVMWDFKNNNTASFILEHYGISKDIIPDIVPTFGLQGYLTSNAAEELGLVKNIPVSYRAGDQPNNAFSLNVLNAGEIAATAGTSGVVYGVSDSIKYDPLSRVNTFAHVNHSGKLTRLGILLCINGTGISNSWIKKILGSNYSYDEINQQASEVEIGSDELIILPFGNGAERMLQNQNIGAHVCNLNFNKHTSSHLFRAVQEGVAFAFKYGIDVMNTLKINPTVIRAGMTNMFLSPVFRSALSNAAEVTIELYNTDGAQGAARGAAYGCGFYSSLKDAFVGFNCLQKIEPDTESIKKYQEVYNNWLKQLKLFLEY